MEGGPSPVLEDAVELAARTGHRALAAGAAEQAVAAFDEALGLVPLDDERRGALLLALGHARVRAGDRPGARAALLDATELARAGDDPELLARAVLEMTAPDAAPRGDAGTVALLEEALGRLHSDNPALRARLLARLSSALHASAAVPQRLAAAEEALALSRDHGGPRTRGYVLVHATIGLTGPDLLERRVTNAAELKALAQRHDEPEWLLASLLQRIPADVAVGDGAGLAADVETLCAVLAGSPGHRLAWLAPSQRALLAAIEGRWSDHERYVAELGEMARGDDARTVRRVQEVVVHVTRGTLGDVQDDLDRAAALLPDMLGWRCAQALAHAEAGRHAEAAALLTELAGDDFAALPSDHTHLVCIGLLTDVCVLLGDAERAAILERLLAPYGGRHIATRLGTYLGPADRHLGQLAALRDDLDEALAHFAAARRDTQRMHAAPYLARIALDEGLALARAGDPRASERLAHAAALADEITMPAIAARARAAGAGPAPAAAPPATAHESVLRREGDVWSFEHDGRVTRVRDAKGIRHLAVLLAAPGVEIHALQLVGGTAPGPAAGAAADAGLSADTGSGTGPQLDAQAKREYRERITELTAELDEAESFNDPERAARAREELDFLARELAGAVGLGGRDRQAASDAERARVNATRAIRTAIRHIGGLDPALGHELDVTIRTGTFCVCATDPRRPVRWRVEPG